MADQVCLTELLESDGENGEDIHLDALVAISCQYLHILHEELTEVAAVIKSEMFVKDSSGPLIANFYLLVDQFSDGEFERHFKMKRRTMEVRHNWYRVYTS